MTDEVVEYSETAMRQGSKSFAAAARLFDQRTREDCMMLYAWCRHCDDVIDGQTLGHAQQADFRDGQQARLDLLRQQTTDALEGGRSNDPIFIALARVAQRAEIPARHPQELLEGFAMDVNDRRYETVHDVLDYGYHVAGVVGVMMAMIMGVRAPAMLDRASDLGIAFQLTNIARDVVDDARAGRVYLPHELLAPVGIMVVQVDDREQWPALHRAALQLLDIAEPYYASAQAGIAALPLRSAWAIATARRVYRAIGQKLRAGGPGAWEQRVSTSAAEKLALLILAFGDAVASRFSRRDASSRAGFYQRP